METYSLREIIKNTALKHSGEITDAGLIFRVNVEEEVPDLYYGNYEHLADMLDYLISISILHTKEGKIVVCVGLEHANNDTEKVVLHIEVIDTGSGLSEDEKEQLLVFLMSQNV